MKLLVNMPKIEFSFLLGFLAEKTAFENSPDTRISKQHDLIMLIIPLCSPFVNILQVDYFLDFFRMILQVDIENTEKFWETC